MAFFLTFLIVTVVTCPLGKLFHIRIHVVIISQGTCKCIQPLCSCGIVLVIFVNKTVFKLATCKMLDFVLFGDT